MCPPKEAEFPFSRSFLHAHTKTVVSFVMIVIAILTHVKLNYFFILWQLSLSRICLIVLWYFFQINKLLFWTCVAVWTNNSVIHWSHQDSLSPLQLLVQILPLLPPQDDSAGRVRGTLLKAPGSSKWWAPCHYKLKQDGELIRLPNISIVMFNLKLGSPGPQWYSAASRCVPIPIHHNVYNANMSNQIYFSLSKKNLDIGPSHDHLFRNYYKEYSMYVSHKY